MGERRNLRSFVESEDNNCEFWNMKSVFDTANQVENGFCNFPKRKQLFQLYDYFSFDNYRKKKDRT